MNVEDLDSFGVFFIEETGKNKEDTCDGIPLTLRKSSLAPLFPPV